MKDFKKKWIKLIFMYNLIDIIAVLAFYPFIPKLLNYPPNSINNAFQVSINGLTYTQQYISILLLCIFVENLILFLTRKKLGKLLLKDNKNIEKKYIDIIKIIERTPKIIYLLQIIAPIVSIICTFLILKGSWGVILRVSLVFFAMLLSVATLSYVFCKGIFKDILIEIFNKSDKDDKIKDEILNELRRHSIKTSVVFTVIPLLVITSVLITFICYSKSIITNGENIYRIYSKEIDDNILNEYNNVYEIENSLAKIKKHNKSDGYFILTLNGEKVRGDIELSEFFVKYITDVAMKNKINRTYEFYATDYEGLFKIISVNNQQLIAGVKYATSTSEMISSVIVVTILLIFISMGLLVYVLNYIFRDITLVTKRLSNMVKSKEVDLSDKIPISSNDEISDLIKSFTAVQEKTNNYIEQIEQDQYTMQRQAQFAILGEFAGGLAHDLNSPLSAVKLDISTFKKYINSNKISAEEETKETLNEMLDNIDNSLNSMGNIIMGVRNQIRATGDSDKEEFLLQDVIDGIKILFRSILMKNNCQLETEIPEELLIYGERNKLDRVIGNLIKNSIDAYVSIGKKGTIRVNAENKNNKTIIAISDEAGGIDEDIKENIFKEIKTTKAENGTGFGLYYSNTIIESSFKGKMYFDSTKNVGTTFYIEIPNNKEEK